MSRLKLYAWPTTRKQKTAINFLLTKSWGNWGAFCGIENRNFQLLAPKSRLSCCSKFNGKQSGLCTICMHWIKFNVQWRAVDIWATWEHMNVSPGSSRVSIVIILHNSQCTKWIANLGRKFVLNVGYVHLTGEEWKSNNSCEWRIVRLENFSGFQWKFKVYQSLQLFYITQIQF